MLNEDVKGGVNGTAIVAALQEVRRKKTREYGKVLTDEEGHEKG